MSEDRDDEQNKVRDEAPFSVGSELNPVPEEIDGNADEVEPALAGAINSQ